MTEQCDQPTSDPDTALTRALKGLRYDDPYPEADIAFLAQFVPEDDQIED